jgi:hypothetical protein
MSFFRRFGVFAPSFGSFRSRFWRWGAHLIEERLNVIFESVGFLKL